MITCGGMVLKVDKAAEELKEKGIDVESIDLRSLAPLDKDTILKSVTKTKRAMVIDEGPMVGGVTSEIAAIIQESLFSDLKGPVRRIGYQPLPPPHSGPLVEAIVPSVDGIVSSALELSDS